MAEMALAAFAGIGEAAVTAGSAIGSAVSGIGTTSLASGILSGTATAASVLASSMAAQQARTTGQVQAMQAVGDADVSRLEGERAALDSEAKAIEIRRDALRKIGAQRVAFAGSGLDISSGQLTSLESSVQREADYGLALERAKGQIAAGEAKLYADRTLAKGQNAAIAGNAKANASYIDAAATGAKGLLSILKRG